MSAAICGKVICSDVFDIAHRLKQIDSRYFVVYNTVKRRYEVHNSGQKGNTFCLVVPYDCLDARTLDYVRRTRVSNSKELIEQIEADNARLQREILQSKAQQYINQALDKGGAM